MKKHNNICFIALLLVIFMLFFMSSCFADGRESFENDETVDISELTNKADPEYDRFEILPSGIELVLSDDGSYYILKSGKKCSMEVVIIPESYNGKPIAEIGNMAFENNALIKSITLPKSILRIGSNAFYGCTSLEYNEYGNAKYLGTEKNPYAFLISSADAYINSVEINEAALVIAQQAFFRNRNLVSVKLPDSIICINSRAFYGCESLVLLDLGNGVKYIDDEAFGHTAVSEIKIPDSTISVGFCAFNYFSGITSLEFGKSLQSIGASAFVRLKTEVLEIPDTVTEIGNGAFAGSEIKKLVIGDGVKVIEAFQGCESLTEIVFGDSVEYISRGAFKGCTSLRNVKLPKSLKVIHYNAFEDCENLEYKEYNGAKYLGGEDSDFECLMFIKTGYRSYDGNLVLHPEVRVIAHPEELYTGSEIYMTNTVTMDGEGKHLQVVDNCVIDPSTKTLVFGANESRIPNDGSVTSIGDYAFYLRGNLNDVILPDGLTSIGDYAFYACDGIGKVKFNTELESIGDYAFAYSDNLSISELPEGLKYIGEKAFTGCNRLSVIYIPGSVEEIGINAFSHCYGAYKIVIGEGVTRLSGAIFDDCNKVTEVNLPSTLKMIDKGAFRQLYSLFKLELPEGLLYIEDYAFQHCPKLMEINMPKSLLGIGMKAFEGCRGLYKVNINSGIIEIGDNALKGISDYAKVTFAGTIGMWKEIDNSDNLILGKDDLKVVCLDGEILLKPDPAPIESAWD